MPRLTPSWLLGHSTSWAGGRICGVPRRSVQARTPITTPIRARHDMRYGSAHWVCHRWTVTCQPVAGTSRYRHLGIRSPQVTVCRGGRPMRDDPTVIALVARATEGEQTAWDEIVERFAPLVWSICRRFRLSEADTYDVGQNVWLRLVEYLPSLREPAALPGWLATTTRRECLRVQRSGWRNERQLAQTELELPADEDTTQVDQWLIAHERELALRRAFAQLGERCQQLLALLMRDPPMPY